MEEQGESANPLLLGWVKEWLDTARERNSKGITTYKNAYESLKACPITFSHPSQLTQLKGFGDKMSARLTDKLKKHCEENGLPMPTNPRLTRGSGVASEQGTGEDGAAAAQPSKKARKPKAYVPAFRSGAYALILALAELDEGGTATLTKAELVDIAQPHCDSSFTAPSDPTKFYTAWNSMKTLLDKEFVYERGRPLRRYALTDEGWEVAKRIKQAPKSGGSVSSSRGQTVANSSSRPQTASAPALVQGDPDGSASRDQPGGVLQPQAAETAHQDVVPDGPLVTDDATLPPVTPIRLGPGTFTVELLLDTREVRSKRDRDYLQDELAKRGVKPITRALEVGDAQWIAVPKGPTTTLEGRGGDVGGDGDGGMSRGNDANPESEIVLDHIVERKRLDDLLASIKDGRFHEQKFRLGRCGAPNVTYLIEDISMDAVHAGRYEEAMQSAIASTQVVNSYFVKRTRKVDDTIRYLARMTRLLKKVYEARELLVIPTRLLTAHNYLPLLRRLRADNDDPGKSWHVSYAAFASLASKSDMITLRDVYLKMLMTTRGVTGEKALEIQRRWRTPHEFVKAFEACGDGEQGKKRKRDMVATGTAGLVGRKKIAKAVSQRIAEVWGDA